MNFKKWLKQILDHPLMPKVIVLGVLLLLLWGLRPFFNMIMMTLFLTLLMGQLSLKLKRYLKVPVPVTMSVIYGGTISALGFVIFKYWQLASQNLNQYFGGVVSFYGTNPKNPIKIFHQVGFISSQSQYELLQITQKLHLNQQLAELPKYLMKHLPELIQFATDMFLAAILSFIIVIELPQLMKFNEKFKHSDTPQFFHLLFELLHQFIQSFTMAIDVQLIVAVINTILTTIGLWLLGYSNLWALALMVWVLSLVPLVGVLISFVPLAILGFANGGIYDVIMVALLLIGVHAMESYVINPRLMSQRTKLPMTYTFVALILGHWYFGIWGLLLAVPLLMFILDFLSVQNLPNEKLKAK